MCIRDRVGAAGGLSGFRGAHALVIRALVGVKGLVFKVAAGLFKGDGYGQLGINCPSSMPYDSQ